MLLCRMVCLYLPKGVFFLRSKAGRQLLGALFKNRLGGASNDCRLKENLKNQTKNFTSFVIVLCSLN